MTNFEIAIKRILGRIEIEGDGEEGGYVNRPDDPGGETKFGITKRYYPELNIKTLTEKQAIAIYKTDYWDRFHMDDIEDVDIAEKLFSLVVNMGGNPAIKCLQRACRACGHYTKDDGILGAGTATAVKLSDKTALLASLKSEAAGMYRYFVAIDPHKKWALEGWLARAYR